jgi:hypothetical protein
MPDLYSQSALAQNTRKSVDSTTFGTRDLVFLQIGNGGQDLSTGYTESGSNFQKLIQTLQQAVEIYGVGIPNSTNVTVVANRQSVPYTGSEESNAGGRVSALETLINAHPDLSGFDVFHGKMYGWSIQNDC